MMGKGDRRQKTPPPGCGLPKPQGRAHPRDRRGTGVPRAEPPADLAALNARCLKFGIPPSEGARKAVSAVWAGSDLGMVLMRQMRSEEAINALWSVWAGFTTAARTYRTRILSQTGAPQNAALPILTERMTSDVSHSVDIRTSDEKDEDAVKAWRRWSGHLARLDVEQRELLMAAEHGLIVLWHNRAPTWQGVHTYSALAALSEMVEADSRKRLTRG